MERFFKTPTKIFIKKQKRSINPLFLDKYGIADVSGKGICDLCSKEYAEESVRPDKTSETHGSSCKYCCHVRRGPQESFPLSL